MVYGVPALRSTVPASQEPSVAAALHYKGEPRFTLTPNSPLPPAAVTTIDSTPHSPPSSPTRPHRPRCLLTARCLSIQSASTSTSTSGDPHELLRIAQHTHPCRQHCAPALHSALCCTPTLQCSHAPADRVALVSAFSRSALVCPIRRSRRQTHDTTMQHSS